MTQKQPTLEEFRASRKEMSWKDCAKLLRIDDEYTDAPMAQVYMDRVYIEDYVEPGYEHENFPLVKGRYVLVVNRDMHFTDDLEKLEAILYTYMMNQEGGF